MFIRIILVSLLLISGLTQAQTPFTGKVGAEQVELYLPMLKQKRVGLVVNQTSRVDDEHLVDFLLKNKVSVKKVFAPEHGFRGDHDAGAVVPSGKDPKTGIDIVSIYGKNKKPSANVLNDLDVIVFDIQDVGVRFYTYINSMFYMMQAAAEHDIAFIVLDRPNPNIAFVDGPMLNPKFRSFVGLLPVPLMHGMTVGELALMIKGEAWLDTIDNHNAIEHQLKLDVIPVAKGYARHSDYILPVPPSPNLPNAQAITLYPSLCFFEATPISIGRGTDFPFQVVGSDQIHIGSFEFIPRSIPGAAANPKLQGQRVQGLDLRNAKMQGFDLSLFIEWFKLFQNQQLTFFQRPDFFDKLAGTDQIRLDMTAGKSLHEIKAKWQQDINYFKRQRAPYLLYQ